MFKELDPILHSQLRLAVMSLLIGNLSVQVQKLKDAGYIKVLKQFKDNYPLTTCAITKQGILAFEDYVKVLQEYLKIAQ